MSWRPGDDTDGGPSRPADVLIRVLAPPLQQGELLQQEASAFGSFGQSRESSQTVEHQSLPLLLFFFFRQQLEEDGDGVQLQAHAFTCKGEEPESHDVIRKLKTNTTFSYFSCY